jgi:hypothetical protein
MDFAPWSRRLVAQFSFRGDAMRNGFRWMLLSAMLVAWIATAPVGVAEEGDRATESGEKVEFAFKWEPGETRYSRMVQETEQDQRTPMMNMTTKMKQTMLMAETCLKVDEEGNMTVRLEYLSIQVRQENSMTGVSEWDSTRPDEGDQDLRRTLRAMVDGSFTITYAPSGEILEVNGFDEMLEKILRDLDPEMRAQLEPMFRQMLSDDGMKMALGDTNAFFPEKAVGVGESWESQTRSGIATMMFEANNKYTLDEIEETDAGRFAKVSSKGDLKLAGRNPDDPPGMLDEFEITIRDGKQEGSFRYNLTAGYTDSLEMTQTYTMVMATGGMEIETDTKSTTKINVIPESEIPEALRIQPEGDEQGKEDQVKEEDY